MLFLLQLVQKCIQTILEALVLVQIAGGPILCNLPTAGGGLTIVMKIVTLWPSAKAQVEQLLQVSYPVHNTHPV